MTSYPRKQSFNTFSSLPELSYNCVAHLLENDNKVWRLLSNMESDCLDENKYPDLTMEEKIDIIYRGADNITSCRVFLDIGLDDVWREEAAILRIAPTVITPDTYVYGRVSMGFEVYSHFKVNHLSNNSTRVVSIIQRLLELFNGAEIDGLGRLYFDQSAASSCKVVTIGRIPYKGMGLIMTNYMLG